MFLAVSRPLAAHEIEGGLRRAEIIRTTLAANVYHAVHSMLLAVHRRVAAHDIEGGLPSARVV